MTKRVSDRRHWDNFWKRDRDLDEIYDNDGRIPEELEKHLKIDGSVTLEVGAATARDSVILAEIGAFAVALDYSHEALRLAGEAAERAGVKVLLVCGDAFALPFRDESMDIVFHQGVLEHFRDPLPLLRENARVIKQTLIALNAWFAGWETQFTPGSLSGLLIRAGLQPEYTYGRFFSPSLAYRILREVLMKLRIKLPLRPVLVPPVHKFRSRLRKRIENSPIGPRFGYIVGIIAGRKLES